MTFAPGQVVFVATMGGVTSAKVGTDTGASTVTLVGGMTYPRSAVFGTRAGALGRLISDLEMQLMKLRGQLAKEMDSCV
jgi:hypothetical protein